MDDDQARQLLAQEHDRLQVIKDDLQEARGAAGELAQELSSADQHPADVGTETFEREKDLSILDSVEGELADVEHALHRIDDGTYGTCEACGKPISDERLAALPATRFCVDDQVQAERELRLSAPHELAPDDEDAATGR